jgi:hypothetical protein
METRNRMDGITAGLAKALLKLMGMILEGKVRMIYMFQIKSFIEDILEKAKFFNYVSTNHPKIIHEYEGLFDALMGEYTQTEMCDNKKLAAIITEINEMRRIYKWKGMMVDSCGRFPLFDESDDCFIIKRSLNDSLGVILVLDGFRQNWIWKGADEIANLSITLKEMDYKKIKCVIRFDLDGKGSENKLFITFLNIENTV